MAKRSKKKTARKKTVNKELSNKIRHLEVLMAFTLRNVDGKSEELDVLFSNQAKRIRAELDKLEENQ